MNLDNLKVCELSDGVVGQVDVAASIQLAHTSSVQHRFWAIQATAARRGPVDFKRDLLPGIFPEQAKIADFNQVIAIYNWKLLFTHWMKRSG